jgi:zinc protease
VFYWQRPTLPLMAMTTLLRSGSDLDPAGKGGVADLTTEMLSQGAGGLSATDFQNALDQLGASFSASAGVENTSVSLSCTQDSFAKALGLYSDALIRPNLYAKEWDRVKQLHIEALQQELDDPGAVAERMERIEFFGMGNPYGRPGDGTLASVPAVTLDDVKAEHAAVYQPNDAVVFAAGSMPANAFEGELDATLGKWQPSGVVVPGKVTTERAPPRGFRVFVVDKPGAVQTVVRFVLPAPTAHDPRRIRLEAIGSLFGGIFTSRLNANLRENKGYTYGAGASYALEPSVGFFVAGADVRTNVTGASLHEFLKEFASIRTGNITADEVRKSAGAMRTARVDSASTVAGLVGTAASMYEDGRSYGDLGKDFSEISGLTPASLNAIVKGALPLEDGVLVLVGDKGQILSQLKGLGLPAPMVVKAE